MPQPTLTQLFGAGASYNSGTGVLIINLNDQEADTGIDSATAQPIEILASLITYPAPWLLANTDEAVMATVTTAVFAPITRNEQVKTQFSFNYQFYGASTPFTFSANDLVS